MAKETGIFTLGEFRELVKEFDGRGFYEIDLGDSVAFTSLYGGRLFAMFPDKNDIDSPNAFWLNPDLKNAIKEWEWFRNKGIWPNYGGDRLEVGPEFSLSENGNPGTTFFCRRPGNYKSWRCQYDMDPGEYAAIIDTSVVSPEFWNIAKIKDYKSKKTDFVEMHRHFKPSRNIKTKGAKSASIRYKDSIESHLFQNAYPWKLVQVPTGGMGTIIFPIKKMSDAELFKEDRPEVTIYMSRGLDVSEYVMVGEDHISVRTEPMQKALYKLAIPPDVSRKIGGYKMVMHLTETPKKNMYQLVILKSSNLPSTSDEIIEVPSISKEDLQSMSYFFKGDCGVPFVYNGPAPEGGSSFTELEVAGKKAEVFNNKYRSDVSGRLEFYWGTQGEIIETATKIGGIKSPYVFV